MANEPQLTLLWSDISRWNSWRSREPAVRPDLFHALLVRAKLEGANLSRSDLRSANLWHADLTGANLEGADLSGANLTGASLTGANLSRAFLVGAKLEDADLSGATLDCALVSGAILRGASLEGVRGESAVFDGADLTSANLKRARLAHSNFSRAVLVRAYLDWADLVFARFSAAELTEANFSLSILARAKLDRANLSKANLSHANAFGAVFTNANLTDANLTGTSLVESTLDGCTLHGCAVYGVSVWNATLTGATQADLRIDRHGYGQITVNDIEVAQFVHLLLENARLRNIIETVTSKVVLLLGRFTPERKAVLDALHAELRRRGYVPILFDFERPSSRDTTETVLTLAGMARFVIADLTDAASVPQELTEIAHAFPSVPIQPVVVAGESEWSMFRDLQRRGAVLPPYVYHSSEMLVAAVKDHLVDSADQENQRRRSDIDQLYTSAELRRRPQGSSP